MVIVTKIYSKFALSKFLLNAYMLKVALDLVK